MTQNQALQILLSGKNVFLTGEPGAGKSYTINMFTAELAKRGKYPDITASTGIAATHINGVTIHSWSGIGIKEVITESDLRVILKKSYVVDRILRAEVLIIDEISMLNAETLDNVDKVTREVKALLSMDNRGKSFGGLQVIFVGDFFQLPPVAKRKIAKFAFESQAWLGAEPTVCYLTEQHRQEDADFLEILNALRNGSVKETHLKQLKARKVAAPKDITRLFTHNKDVDSVNTEELRKLKTEQIVFGMESSGIPFMVDILKRNCLSPEILKLKEGAPVMFTQNDRIDPKNGKHKARWVNGTLGTVTGFTGDGMPIVLTKDGKELRPDYVEWKIEERGVEKARIAQIPLRLAWAITVHKCQGMSLDAATMDLSEAFEYGQGYVALSRVRSLSGLYLEGGLNKMALEMHPTIIKKDMMFRKLGEGV